MKKRIYLDHASTTYMDPRVKKAMDEFFIKKFGNPSSISYEGRLARKAVEESRKKIAKIINAQPSEIIFTNGGTESDNMAIFGVANNVSKGSPWIPRTTLGNEKPHIITTKIEHHAVLNPIKVLKKRGWQVTYLNIGEDGIVNVKDLEKALQSDTVLVSIMYANNEIGTIQPIEEISKIIKSHKFANKKDIYFHTDACQATGYLDLDVKKLGIDLMTLNGSKIYGPKGIGILYVRKGINLSPIIYGGEQEMGLRPGTENVPAIVGMTEALKIAQKERIKESKRLAKLRDYFIKRLLKEIPQIFLNGHPTQRLPNNINVSILGAEGESIVLYLDELGISCSTGSACTSSSLEPSHVIMALRNDYAYSHGSLRFTMGRKNTKADIDYVMKILPGIIKKLRNISATWQM